LVFLVLDNSGDTAADARRFKIMKYIFSTKLEISKEVKP
jgi:hypothetical protein